MVSRKQAFAFFLGALLLIYGLFLLISSVLEIHPIPVLIFGVFFLLLGRQVVIERYEAFSSHRSKLIFSSISAVIIILLSFLIVYFKNKEYPESVEWAGLGEVLLCLFAAHLILVINILLWFIVLIISWISGWLSAFGEARKKTEKEGAVPPFDRLVLCDESYSRVKVFVTARVSEGCLKISGQDSGEEPEEFSGKEKSEYFYDFDRENTESLFALLSPEREEIAEVLVREYSGIDGCSKLREFSDANRIKYSFITD